MADVVYSVEVQFLQSGALDSATSGIGKLQGQTKKWTDSLFSGVADFAGSFNSAIDSVAGKLAGLGVSAWAGATVAAATGLGVATKAAFDFNEQMENSAISLAAIANANGMADGIGNGMRMASETLKDMRKDAAELPGEFKDLVNIMTTIAPIAGQMGLGQAPTETLAKNTMAAAAVLSIPQNVAAREMAMLLEGNAKHSMPLFNRLGMGVTPKDFNALTPEKRLEKVTQALDKLSPAVKVFQNSWDGIKTTAIDNLRAGVGAIAGPLFGSVKGKLQEFNNWVKVGDNKDKLSQWGETLGIALDKAFNGSIEAIQHWYPIVSTFARHLHEQLSAAWARLAPAVQSIFGKIENFMMDPEAVTKIVDAAKTVAELRVGGAVLQGGSSLLGSEAGGAAMAALGVEGTVATGGALIALAIAVEGATSAYLDANSIFHGVATFLVNDIGSSLQSIFTDLKGIGSDLQPIAEMFGVVLLGALDIFAGALEYAISGVKDLTGAFSDAASWIRKSLGILNHDPDTDENGMLKPTYANLYPYSGIAIKEMDTGTAVREKERKIPQSVTHVHRVEINVNSNQDPNRIAKRTLDVLTDIARHPKVAAQTGAPVLSR